jgi:peptidoglycan-N-acetylglucosamine deacetylase
LRTASVTATFNVVGVRALEQPSLLREIVAAGHEIGNHTHHHDDLSALPADRVHAEIRAAQDAIEQCVQVPVTLFRPPRGELTGIAAREAAALGMDVLMWTISRDVTRIGTPASVSAGLTAPVVAGDVIALHDGLGHAGFDADSSMATLLRRRRDVEMQALPHALVRLHDRGLRCVAVRELLALGGH